MKKKGKIDNMQLAKLGLEMPIVEAPNENIGQKEDVEAVKKRQTVEIKALLASEKKAEGDRLSSIQSAQEEADKQRLEKENEQAKALSSDKIAKLQSRHQTELKALSE